MPWLMVSSIIQDISTTALTSFRYTIHPTSSPGQGQQFPRTGSIPRTSQHGRLIENGTELQDGGNRAS